MHGAVAGALDQRRPGLHRSHPRHRARVAVRRLRGRRGRPDGRGAARRPARPGDRPGPADLAAAPATGSPGSSIGPAPPGPRSCAAAGRRAGLSRRGPTTSRPWSTDVAQRRRDRARGGVRAGARRCCRSSRRRGASSWPTTPPYGLAASAWTRDVYRAQRATREIRPAASGSTTTSRSSARCRTAGCKASGFGKDMSVYSLEEYTVIKHVMSDLTGAARKAWHRTVFGDRSSHDQHTNDPTGRTPPHDAPPDP